MRSNKFMKYLEIVGSVWELKVPLYSFLLSTEIELMRRGHVKEELVN